MKKIILLCMVFVFSNTFYAQTATEKKVKTEKKTTTTTTKLKKDGTPDKRYKTESKVVLKKDGTVDKRYKNTSTTVTTTKAKAKKMTAAEEKEDMKETTASKSEEKKVKDKATGSYKGKRSSQGQEAVNITSTKMETKPISTETDKVKFVNKYKSSFSNRKTAFFST